MNTQKRKRDRREISGRGVLVIVVMVEAILPLKYLEYLENEGLHS